MDYMKWNCFDLAEQQEILEQCEREMQKLYDDLLIISRQLDEEVAESLEIKSSLNVLLSKTEDIVADLRTEYIALDQVVDIYYFAEKKAKEQSEALPTKITTAKYRISSAQISEVAWIDNLDVAATVGHSVVVEDWLAELVYWNDQFTGKHE